MLDFWMASKSIFRSTKDGLKLFYPNGNLGAGYIIPSAEIYKRLMRGYIAMCIGAVILMLIGVLFVFIFDLNLYLSIIVVVIAYLVAYYAWVRQVTRNLDKVK